MTNQVHLVIESLPLTPNGKYSEMVRYVFADREKAQLMADELEGAYGGLDSHYFVATHSVVS